MLVRAWCGGGGGGGEGMGREKDFVSLDYGDASDHLPFSFIFRFMLPQFLNQPALSVYNLFSCIRRGCLV